MQAETHYQLSRVVRKPAFCICENKDADQLRGNRKADQRLSFRYIDSTNRLSPVAVQPGLCRTRSETPKTGFLTTSLNCTYQTGRPRRKQPTIYTCTQVVALSFWKQCNSNLHGRGHGSNLLPTELSRRLPLTAQNHI